MPGPDFSGLGPLKIDNAEASYFINGPVGIGTTNPAELSGTILQVRKDQDGRTLLVVRNDNAGGSAYPGFFAEVGSPAEGNPGVALNAYRSAYTALPEYASAGVVDANVHMLKLILTAARGDGEIRFYVGGRTADKRRMTIDKDGKVGIGKDAPEVKLHVQGDGIRLSATPPATKFIELRTDGGEVDLQSSNAKLALNYSGNDIVMVVLAGNVGIGTNNPQAKLDVAGGAVRVGGREVINANGQALYA